MVSRRTMLTVTLALLGISLAWAESGTSDRETVLDRKVHIEKELILDVPEVPRFCDSLDISKQRVDVGDCRLYCEQEGDGIPLVLLHGGPGGTHHYFHPSFSCAKSFAKVIYYDQRGCGLSDYKAGEGYTVEQAVDDLENLRKALNIDRWFVLGYSYGGALAQGYAVKYSDHLAGLVLVGSSVPMNVPLDRTRQWDFITKEEHKRIQEIRSTPGLTLEQYLYNMHLNGDWKRQSYYRPSRERLAQQARYEWRHANMTREALVAKKTFNDVMSADLGKISLAGAFEGCPIPTIILEGKWDLTWNTDKPGKLLKQHPGAKLVMFERSGHMPFDDETDKFFAVLRDFISGAPPAPAAALSAWQNHLAGWRKARALP